MKTRKSQSADTPRKHRQCLRRQQARGSPSGMQTGTLGPGPRSTGEVCALVPSLPTWLAATFCSRGSCPAWLLMSFYRGSHGQGLAAGLDDVGDDLPGSCWPGGLEGCSCDPPLGIVSLLEHLIYPEPQTVTLFRNRVFAMPLANMRSDWVRMGPSPMAGVCAQGGAVRPQTETGKLHPQALIDVNAPSADDTSIILLFLTCHTLSV